MVCHGIPARCSRTPCAQQKIVTIEGLADAAPPARSIAVQQGVVDEQGFQCAFCMPGFVMATVGYLKTNPEPDATGTGARYLGQSLPLPGLRQDPHRADARRREHEEGLTMAATKLVGENYTTPDLVAKVTGKAKYAEDYRVDGMLFCQAPRRARCRMRA